MAADAPPLPALDLDREQSKAMLAQLSTQTGVLLSNVTERLRLRAESKKAGKLDCKDTRCGRCCSELSGSLAHGTDRSTWRRKLGHALESHVSHAVILCLIFLDVMAVLCEVMLRNVCVAPVVGTADDVRLYKWGEGLSWFSRAVLLVLLAHLILLVVSFGKSFFKKWMYVLDLVIVLVALGLEMAHLGIELAASASHGGSSTVADAHAESQVRETVPAGLAGDGGTLIVVLLCWRVVRIVHGFAFTGTAHTDEQELEEAKQRIEELEKHFDVMSRSLRQLVDVGGGRT